MTLTVPEPTVKMIEAAEAESATALREGTELVVAGLRKIGVAFFRAGEAESLSGKLRRAGADVAPRAGLTRLDVECRLQAAIEASYVRRNTSEAWGETLRLTIAPRDCVER